MRIDVQLDAPPRGWGKRAQELADLGLDGVFSFEGRHDVFLPLAAAVQQVPIDIMTNIAVALPRSPLHLAHLANDLQLLSEGRFRLGLGSQVRRHIESRYGAPWSRPAARMRETVLAVKEILQAWQTGDTPQFTGEFTQHTFMPPSFRPDPNPFGVPPVMMGALGPVMTRTAAEVADGLLVMPFNTDRHFRDRTMPAVRSGLAKAGRADDEFVIVPQVITAVGSTDDDLTEAIRGARRLVAFYASTPNYQSVLEVHDRAELQGELSQALRAGDLTRMESLIDDEFFAAVVAVGTPEQVAAQIKERFADVADRVCTYFPEYTPSDDTLRGLVSALHG